MVLRYIALFLITSFLSIPESATAACVESLEAKIALHLTAPPTKIPCGPGQLSCSFSGSEVVTSGDLDQEYKVYVLLADWKNEPFIQIQIGVYYDPVENSGVDVLEFQSCASSNTPIGDWPSSGSQLVMTYASCQSTEQDDVLVLGSFSVIAHTPGSLTLTPLTFTPLVSESPTVCRLVDCDLEEKILSPERMGHIGLGQSYFGFDPCSGFIDVFPGPCCLVNSCLPRSSLGCCWAQGGTLLDYMATCGACTLDMLPNTWGRLKSRYE